MKIAYVTLLVFVLIVGYQTLNEHTSSLKTLRSNNNSIILTLESIDRHLESIDKSMQVTPLPTPIGERPSKEPKVASTPPKEMPVRRPEIIE